MTSQPLGPFETDPFVRHPAITATCLGTLQEEVYESQR